MTVTVDRHPCAVCERPIIHAFLMCGPHWRLVPPDQQLAVYRAWGALTSIQHTGKRASPQALQAYLAARDAAIAGVRATLGLPSTDTTPAKEAA